MSQLAPWSGSRLMGTALMILAQSVCCSVSAASSDIMQMHRSDEQQASQPAVKYVSAGVLNTAYLEAGPAEGPVVILLHGWPYGLDSFTEVTPRLVAAGYHVFIPSIRGHGATRFLSEHTLRNGEPAALAEDILQFMNALQIDKAILAGFDWGARTANIISALWPERVKAMVSVSGYLIGSQASGKKPLTPENELRWWYQYYFATERGQAGYSQYTNEFAKLIWRLASPQWQFDDNTFARSEQDLANPDHVSVVLHNYRWRLGLAEGESRYQANEDALAAFPSIHVPTITLEGDANGAPHPQAESYRAKFTGKYQHRLIEGGIGHNLPQEAPAAFAQAIIDVDTF